MKSIFKALKKTSKSTAENTEQQQQQDQSITSFTSPPTDNFIPPSSAVYPTRGRIEKIDQHSKEDDELVAVIISIRYDHSYDELFTTIKQQAAPGTRVSTYLVQGLLPEDLQNILESSDNEVKDAWGEGALQMALDLQSIDPTSVVFNWECCSGCETKMLTHTPMDFVRYLLDRSFMVMFSDFSVKGLIASWDDSTPATEMLGPNPFRNLGTFNKSVKLRFDPKVLANCDDSAQLQILGELCNNGEATVRALSSTIAFAVDNTVQPDSTNSIGWNKLQILTIATDMNRQPATQFVRNRAKEVSKIGEHEGLVGHVLLFFPSGGRMLVACPHWIELSQLDVTKESLLEVTATRYGETAATQMRAEMANLSTDNEWYDYMQASSTAYVQCSAPCRQQRRKK